VAPGVGWPGARKEVFVPVSLPAPAAVASTGAPIQLQMRRGALAVEVRWPLEAAEECAAWLREILK
jgi:transposase